MSQPGWYADPYNTGGLRWWDGQRWTEHAQQAPPPQQAPAYQAPQPQPQLQPQQPPQFQQPQPMPQQPPLDAPVRGLHLHADDQIVVYGAVSMQWIHVEWVAYWSVLGEAGEPAGQWVFQVGRHPFQGGPRVEVLVEQEDLWNGLVERCRRIVEPRLIGELTARVQAGQAIDVGQGLTVHPGGIRGGQISLGWTAIANAVVADGRVWIHQPGGGPPALYVPQQNPNAVLIPALLDALRR